MIKIFRVAAATLIIIVSLLFNVGVEAEIKTYDGVGRYVMSDFENQDIAKQRARYRAEKDAQKKAGVYVKSYSRSINSELTDNEVSAVMNQITNIVGEVKYDRKIETVDGEQVIIWTASLTANIDTNGIYEFIKRDEKDKVTIVQQNESFQDAIAKNENLITELKTQYKNAKTQAEKDKLVDRLKQLDRDFLAEQKPEEANKVWGNYKKAPELCNEALELKPNFAKAYIYRGFCHSFIGHNDDLALSDYSKAIEPDWLDEILSLHYFSRGTVYYNLRQYEQAIKDFDKAIRLNPKGSFAYKWCGESYQKLGIATKAQAYFDKAKELEA